MDKFIVVLIEFMHLFLWNTKMRTDSPEHWKNNYMTAALGVVVGLIGKYMCLIENTHID